MKLPQLKIGELVAKVPIVQGGMGIGVSLSGLASAVANEGGVGIISGVNIGYREEDFTVNCKEANIRALKKEIKTARELAPDGIIGVNFLFAMNNYDDLVRKAVEEEIDLVVTGAGLPLHLPVLVKGSKTKAIPIVSSGKAAAVLLKHWDKKYDYIPEMIVVEGPEAGGHLGFSLEQLESNISLKDILPDVFKAIKPFEDKHNTKISVVCGGGIYTGKDISEYIKLGASGVQMATRFVATYECDAAEEYKNAYIQCSKEKLKIVKSPVGMPGRAIENDFLTEISKGKLKVDKCYKCLKKCNPEETPYCITKALIEAVKGNVEQGLIFTGSNAYKLDKIVSVKQLMKELVEGAELYL